MEQKRILYILPWSCLLAYRFPLYHINKRNGIVSKMPRQLLWILIIYEHILVLY